MPVVGNPESNIIYQAIDQASTSSTTPVPIPGLQFGTEHPFPVLFVSLCVPLFYLEGGTSGEDIGAVSHSCISERTTQPLGPS